MSARCKGVPLYLASDLPAPRVSRRGNLGGCLHDLDTLHVDASGDSLLGWNRQTYRRDLVQPQRCRVPSSGPDHDTLVRLSRGVRTVVALDENKEDAEQRPPGVSSVWCNRFPSSDRFPRSDQDC